MARPIRTVVKGIRGGPHRRLGHLFDETLFTLRIEDAMGSTQMKETTAGDWSRETPIYRVSRPGEGSPGIFSGGNPVTMERFESRASQNAR